MKWADFDNAPFCSWVGPAPRVDFVGDRLRCEPGHLCLASFPMESSQSGVA